MPGKLWHLFWLAKYGLLEKATVKLIQNHYDQFGLSILYGSARDCQITAF